MTEAATTRKDSETKRVRELVDRAQKGDRTALEELYLIHFDRIYSYLHVSVGNRHDAEDLTTQTFLKMLESIGRFRWRSAPFSAWLFRIAHNLAMDHFRANRRWQPEEEVPEVPGSEERSAEDEALHAIGRPATSAWPRSSTTGSGSSRRWSARRRSLRRRSASPRCAAPARRCSATSARSTRCSSSSTASPARASLPTTSRPCGSSCSSPTG